MRNRGWVLVALAAHLLVPSLQAQWTTGGGGMWGGGGLSGGHGGRGGMHGGPPGHRMELPTPEEVEGPLAPAEMSDVAELDSAGMARYADQYAPHMAATAPVRDSLRIMLRSLHEERDSGDWDAMRADMREREPVISRLWKDLSKRDEQFYKDAKKAFTKDERKKFEEWQDEEKKAREAEHPRGPGGQPPG